jgi:hypothetical protein
MAFDCNFCKKSYSNIASFTKHQQTNKQCLQIQSEKGILSNKKLFECSWCKKELSSAVNLNKHTIICKKKIENDKKELENTVKKIEIVMEDKIEEVAFTFRNKQEELEYELRIKEEKIKELQDKLDKHEKAPKIINNTKNITNHITNNNLTIYEVMTPERVEEFFKKHYKLDTLLEGLPGLARFICNGFIREKASYHCTDRSRHKFIMNDSEGRQVEDTDCEKLVSLTAPGMPHIKDVYDNGLFTVEEEEEKQIHDQYRSISNIDKDRSKFKSELSKIVPTAEEPYPPDKQWMRYFEMMREGIDDPIEKRREKREKEKQDKNKKDKKDSNMEEEPVLEMKTIGGISLGQLDVHRQAYRKRLEQGIDEIKAPKRLSDQFKTNPELEKEYIAFITS